MKKPTKGRKRKEEENGEVAEKTRYNKSTPWRCVPKMALGCMRQFDLP